VGPRTGLDCCGKSRSPPGFDPLTVQTVASRYTDWAVAQSAEALRYKPEGRELDPRCQWNFSFT